jgi:hypothetical protein
MLSVKLHLLMSKENKREDKVTTPVGFEAFGNFAKPILLEQQQMQVQLPLRNLAELYWRNSFEYLQRFYQ